MVDGYSLEAQEKSIRAYVKSKFPHARTTVYQESYTGSELDRPEFNRLLASVKKKHINAVVVWKIDRMSRSVKDLVNVIDLFWKHDVSFLSVEENVDFQTPTGRMMYYNHCSMAEMERHNIINRTLSGKIMSACLGNFTGSWAPYGYKKIKNPNATKGSVLKIIPTQAHWVRQMYDCYVWKKMCPERIALWMNEQNIPYDPQDRTSKKGDWTADVVYRLLKNEIYQGTHVANKKDVMGKELPKEQWTISQTPVIVDPLLWNQAQEARTGRRKFHGKDIYLLSGKIKDGDLEGNKTFVGIQRTKGGISYRRKQCHDLNGNYHPSFEIPGFPLEDYVWSLVKNALNDPETFYNSYLEQLRRRNQQTPENRSNTGYDEQHISNLKKRLSVIHEQEIPRIQTAYEKGIYDEDQTQQRMQVKRDEISHLKAQISDSEKTTHNEKELHREYSCLKQLSTHYRKALEKLTQAQKKDICQLLVDQMILTRTKECNQWQIEGKIVMRFNLPLQNPTLEEGRTTFSSDRVQNDAFGDKFMWSGATADTGYRKARKESNYSGRFVFDFKFEKIWECTNGKGIWKSTFTNT